MIAPTLKDKDLIIGVGQDIDIAIRLDLIGTDFVKIGEIEGLATSISYNIAADSDIRRTCSLSMYVQDDAYIANSFGNIWADRLIYLYCGIRDPEADWYVWYMIGSFMQSGTSYQYDETSKELSLSLIDLMAATTDSRGSPLGGGDMTIPVDSNARSAMIATVGQFSPFKRYSVQEFPDTIPYDLDFSADSLPYDVLKAILDLFPNYEMYYSPEGEFTCAEIPTKIEDPIFVDQEFMDKIIISESRSNDFKNIRNMTEIFGKVLDAKYTASQCTTTGSTYNLTFSNTLSVLEANSTYSFTPNTNSKANQQVKIQDFPAYPLKIRKGASTDVPVVAGDLESGAHYVIKYLDSVFYLQGESEIHAIVMERNTAPTNAQKQEDKDNNNCRVIYYVINPDSPFSVERIGEARKVLRDGEYADIHTSQLAVERAKYENWKTTRWQDSVSLTTLFVPWMDVNKKIAYTSPLTGEVNQYLVQSIDANPIDFTMTMQLIQFYPFYPW